MNGSGEFWVAAAALVAIEVARGRTEDEIALLAAFFNALSDNLELIATVLPPNEPDSPNKTVPLIR